jgi:hypothetical protein
LCKIFTQIKFSRKFLFFKHPPPPSQYKISRSLVYPRGRLDVPIFIYISFYFCMIFTKIKVSRKFIFFKHPLPPTVWNFTEPSFSTRTAGCTQGQMSTRKDRRTHMTKAVLFETARTRV